MSTNDPLNEFFKIQKRVSGHPHKFEGGEHLWLGNAGTAAAIKSRKDRGLPVAGFGPFQRRFAPEELSYGEIVAFSGDFYETPDDLFDEKPALLPWLYEENDLSDLRRALRREVDWIDLTGKERKTAYPDENITLWWNAKRFIELGLKNTVHYGWHNTIAYATWHAAALDLAQQAAKAPDGDARSVLFRRAAFTNGFADHFLTDAFAAGHVRSPAEQLRKWAQTQGMSDKLAGALLKLIHDQDGHIKEFHGPGAHVDKEEGLLVTNARGEKWRTRCDGQLFLIGKDDPAVKNAVAAVADSVEDLLDVYNGAAIPNGVFRATERIPWPHPEERSLVDKFPANISDADLKKLHDSIKWYVKLPGISTGIQPIHIAQCFAALPAIMQQFRDDVAEQVANPSPAILRLSPELINGYKAIR